MLKLLNIRINLRIYRKLIINHSYELFYSANLLSILFYALNAHNFIIFIHIFELLYLTN
jgi:hypothetical protein